MDPNAQYLFFFFFFHPLTKSTKGTAITQSHETF